MSEFLGILATFGLGFGTTAALAHVATGQIAAHLLFHLSSPVHTAAGCLLAEEAGALVTDLRGEPWTVDTRGMLTVGSPAMQHELLEMIAATV